MQTAQPTANGAVYSWASTNLIIDTKISEEIWHSQSTWTTAAALKDKCKVTWKEKVQKGHRTVERMKHCLCKTKQTLSAFAVAAFKLKTFLLFCFKTNLFGDFAVTVLALCHTNVCMRKARQRKETLCIWQLFISGMLAFALPVLFAKPKQNLCAMSHITVSFREN